VSGLADALIARIVEQSDLLAAMNEHCQGLHASREELVSVEVDGLGAMTGLWLSPRALKLESDALARLIVDTARAAAEVCVERQNRLFAEFTRRMRTLEQKQLTGRDGTTMTTG
jgi:DNA-binding protein YbaB